MSNNQIFSLIHKYQMWTFGRFIYWLLKRRQNAEKNTKMNLIVSPHTINRNGKEETTLPAD